MNPKILHGKNIIIQGITGSQGSFHTKAMLAYGTHIIGGTSPNKTISDIAGVPVYSSISSIHETIDISIIFVPAQFAKSAIFEAIDNNVPLIICITEHIPVHDMLQIKQHIAGKLSYLIGPNCPGILIPGTHNLGITPAHLSTPGDTAIVSRSGTLTYEVMDSLTRRGIGQKYIIGIGGDPIKGTGFIECLKLFEQDSTVKRIIMIGEIGGNEENTAADYIQKNITKPVYAYIAGHTAPVGVQMGHAGAILGSSSHETAAYKTVRLAKAGAITASSVAALIDKIK